MIIINVTVPMMGREYDFQVDENVSVSEICREIVEMICRNEQCSMAGDADGVLMWEKRTMRMLRQDQTAGENGLMTGSRVLLT